MTLPDLGLLRARLAFAVAEERRAGRDVDAVAAALERAPASYDALDALARDLAAARVRADWPYVEPDDLESIRTELDPGRPTGATPVDDAAARVEAAFVASVCGCMLGKPVEMNPTLAELRDHLEPLGEWPIRDYLTEQAASTLRLVPWQLRELARERIDHVAPDDDLNYTVLGMLVLERHGATFTRDNVRTQWLLNLPVLQTFGPERAWLAATATSTLEPWEPFVPEWATYRPVLDDDWMRWNPGVELCGALIRADAYGYACLGNPELAAELAWRDAGMTHRRTGLYGAMFVAAAIASAPLHDDPLDVFRAAVGFVPQRSRLAEAVRFALDEVAAASDWLDGYERIHARFGDFGHCMVLQEVGTLVNTLRFAQDVGDGICIQVMQGNDTDSFGATAGSILGAHLGPGHLEERWIAPFGDRINLSMAMTWESSLSSLAARMAGLPASVRV